MARLLLLNGPNLNLLGTREPAIYGADTLSAIEQRLTELASRPGYELGAFQSNAEHELIDRIQRSAVKNTQQGQEQDPQQGKGGSQGKSVTQGDQSNERCDFLIFNPGGFTHTSVALRDALLAVKLPFIEVHLSNIQAREPFRRHSYFSDIARGSIVGLGPLGYELAVSAAI